MQSINEIRQSTGMSQAKFCEALNIPKRTVQDWEQGLRKCPEYVAELIAYRVANDPTIPKVTTPTSQSAGRFAEKKFYYAYRNDGTSEPVAVITANFLCEAKKKAQDVGFGEGYRIEEAKED